LTAVVDGGLGLCVLTAATANRDGFSVCVVGEYAEALAGEERVEHVQEALAVVVVEL
jgi:hypothetical protein